MKWLKIVPCFQNFPCTKDILDFKCKYVDQIIFFILQATGAVRTPRKKQTDDSQVSIDLMFLRWILPTYLDKE